MLEHEMYMERCLQLAALGTGSVSPNPLVGAVIVYRGQIIAEAWHERFGGPHAEALAIQHVLQHYNDGAERLKESTLYVNLEPCSHHGKTPPCADLIIQYRLKGVVIACRDPFEAVNGRGIARLKEAGIPVFEDVLRDKALHLNRRFFTRIAGKRPYIILKWAQTADGYFAPADGSQRWITGRQARQLVHRWRNEEDAVLVGKNTALADNPQLNVRYWKGRNPKRIVIDRDLELPSSLHLFDRTADTLVFNAHTSDWQENLKYIALENFDLYLPQQIVYQLYLMDIQSLIIEGGAATLSAFIAAGLWDEARVFTSPQRWGSGLTAINLNETGSVYQKIGIDKLTIYFK